MTIAIIYCFHNKYSRKFSDNTNNCVHSSTESRGGVLCFWGGANYKAYSCLHDCGERRSLLSAHAYVTFNEKKWLRMNGTQKTKKLKIKKKIYGEPSRLVWDERQLRGLPIWTILRSTDPLLLPFSHLVFIPYQVSHSERCSHIQRQK